MIPVNIQELDIITYPDIAQDALIYLQVFLLKIKDAV
jgi:hypothetical protein